MTYRYLLVGLSAAQWGRNEQGHAVLAKADWFARLSGGGDDTTIHRFSHLSTFLPAREIADVLSRLGDDGWRVQSQLIRTRVRWAEGGVNVAASSVDYEEALFLLSRSTDPATAQGT